MKNLFFYSNVGNLYTSLVCLFYIRFFENNLWGKIHTNVLLYLYEYITIPLFYFTLAIPLSNMLFKNYNTKISVKMKRIILYILLLLSLFYMIYIFFNILGYSKIHFVIRFYSGYSLIFFSLGILFSLTKNTLLMKG